MKYLIAEANYGGRVTDDWDRRLVNVYIATFFCPECVDEQTKFRLSELPDYVLPPEDADLEGFKVRSTKTTKEACDSGPP